MGKALYNKVLAVWKLVVFVVMAFIGTAAAPYFTQADAADTRPLIIMYQPARPLQPVFS